MLQTANMPSTAAPPVAGTPSKARFLGLTFADFMSLVTAYLFYAQPGIDPKVVMQFLIDNCFFGSMAFCSIIGTFASHKLFEWGGMAYYTFLYRFENYLPSFVAGSRVHPVKPWPWNDENAEVGETYNKLERKSIAFIATFHAVVTVVQAIIVTSVVQWAWVANTLQWNWIDNHPDLTRADPATIPSKATVAYQCLVSTLVAETGFYFCHRLLHNVPWLYYYHKRHHEYRYSTVYATFYVGFFDSLITDMIPAGFGIMYFQMHQWTIWMFTLPLIINAMRVHCGYDTASLYGMGFDPTTTLPLCTDCERAHDMHHRLNTGNFGGAYFLLDRLFGTWLDPDLEGVTPVVEPVAATDKTTKKL
jgi:sterol desaturase/sphingolipid hydroxylase (fatty acid hydroxylase superfamily)